MGIILLLLLIHICIQRHGFKLRRHPDAFIAFDQNMRAPNWFSIFDTVVFNHPIHQIYHSLTHCCAWPAEGRSVLHIERSWLAIWAAPTDRPMSSSTCCNQVLRGRPGGRFQSAAGGVPVWASFDSWQFYWLFYWPIYQWHDKYMLSFRRCCDMQRVHTQCIQGDFKSRSWLSWSSSHEHDKRSYTIALRVSYNFITTFVLILCRK